MPRGGVAAAKRSPRSYRASDNQGFQTFPPLEIVTAMNHAHPLAGACVFLALFNGGSVDPENCRNLAAAQGHPSQAHGLPTIVGSSITPATYLDVECFDFAGDNNADRLNYGTVTTGDRLALQHTAECTIAWCQAGNMGTGSTPSQFPHIMCWGQSGVRDVRIYHNRSISFQRLNLDTSANTGQFGVSSYPPGDLVRVTASAIVRNGDTARLYSINDMPGNRNKPNVTQLGSAVTGYGSGAFPHTAGNEFAIGNWCGGDTDRNMMEKMMWVAIFDRALDITELDTLLGYGGIIELGAGQSSPDAALFDAGSTTFGGGGGGGGSSLFFPFYGGHRRRRIL